MLSSWNKEINIYRSKRKNADYERRGKKLKIQIEENLIFCSHGDWKMRWGRKKYVIKMRHEKVRGNINNAPSSSMNLSASS